MIEFQALDNLMASVEMVIAVPFMARNPEDLAELNDRSARGRRRMLLQEAYPALECEVRDNLSQLFEKENRDSYLRTVRNKLLTVETYLSHVVEHTRPSVITDKERRGSIVEWAESMIYIAACDYYRGLISTADGRNDRNMHVLDSTDDERLQLCCLNMIALGVDTCLLQAVELIDRQMLFVVEGQRQASAELQATEEAPENEPSLEEDESVFGMKKAELEDILGRANFLKKGELPEGVGPGEVAGVVEVLWRESIIIGSRVAAIDTICEMFGRPRSGKTRYKVSRKSNGKLPKSFTDGAAAAESALISKQLMTQQANNNRKYPRSGEWYTDDY